MIQDTRTAVPAIFVSPGLKHVRITGGFWERLMEVNRRVTLPIQYEQCKKTGRIDAFRLTWKEGDDNPPHIFWDSDVGKWIEAAAYNLAAYPDAELEQLVDNVIDLIARAQRPDGYVNTHFTVVEPEKRWTNLRHNHELYCAGHLMEGAVAYYQATGKRRFLDIMCRYADHIDKIFGRRKNQKRGYCGHEEIELALMKLYAVTNEGRYLDLARFFIDERGRSPHYFDQEARARGEDPRNFWAGTYEYNQSHLPVMEQTTVVGHAVRAMYLYCGMTDIALATGDRALRNACKRLWRNLVERRMHITGGLGPAAANEGFTCDYDLPNEGAYLETCAAIGLVFWAQRMLKADLDHEIADVMERALYNGTISGVSCDGKRFFYGNPLAAHTGFDGNGRFVEKRHNYRRSEWFGCACCPPNIARMIAQFPDFMYSTRARELAVHLYAQSEGHVVLAGQTVRISQETSYPWEERVAFTITPEQTRMWTLALRIPGWCRDAKLCVNGKAVVLGSATKRGYARIRRKWHTGDRVDLVLPMPVELIEAHPAVRQDGGRVALQRGPVVYCIEEVDNGGNLNDIVLRPDPVFTITRPHSGLLAGVPRIHAKAWRREPGDWKGKLYGCQGSRHVPCDITAIPYFMWGNRSPGEMLVWIRGAEQDKSSVRGKPRR